MSATKAHYLPNGKAYTGLTHKSGGVLMTGAKHTASSQILKHSAPRKTKK